jgi:hypothetical protein
MASNNEAGISADISGQQQLSGVGVEVPAPVQPMAELPQQSDKVQTNGHAASAGAGAGTAQNSRLDSSSSRDGVKKKVKRNVALHVGYVGTNYTGEQHSASNLQHSDLQVQRPLRTVPMQHQDKLLWTPALCLCNKVCRVLCAVGLQANRQLPELATIEGVLEKAILKAGMITEANYGDFRCVQVDATQPCNSLSVVAGGVLCTS